MTPVPRKKSQQQPTKQCVPMHRRRTLADAAPLWQSRTLSKHNKKRAATLIEPVHNRHQRTLLLNGTHDQRLQEQQQQKRRHIEHKEELDNNNNNNNKDGSAPPQHRNLKKSNTLSAWIGQSSLCTKLSKLISFNGPAFIFLVMHAVACWHIFGHFFAFKFLELEEALAEDAPNRIQKRWIPALEFGAMHANLFNLGVVIPLTMCRFSIEQLKQTWLNRFIPFHLATHFHKYIGYVVAVQFSVTTPLFFAHFGTLCADAKAGEEVPQPDEPGNGTTWCDKFTEEIALTGYGILICFIILFVTSLGCIRNGSRYRFFYIAHHIFIALYLLIVMHTFDRAAREGRRNRSQLFKFLVGPLTIYIIDRIVMTCRMKTTSVYSVRAFLNPQSLVLRIRWPPGFEFYAGEYVQLNFPDVSKLSYHPFSVVSCPQQGDTIDICLKVIHRPGSWTSKVFQHVIDLLDREGGNHRRHGEWTDGTEIMLNENAIRVRILGPYAAPSSEVADFDHAVLVCSGTGAVPMISQLQNLANLIHVQQARNLARPGPDHHNRAVALAATQTLTAEKAKKIIKELERNETRVGLDKLHRHARDSASASLWGRALFNFFCGTIFGIVSLCLQVAEVSCAVFALSFAKLDRTEVTDAVGHDLAGESHPYLMAVNAITLSLFCVEIMARIYTLRALGYAWSNSRLKSLRNDAIVCIPMVIVVAAGYNTAGRVMAGAATRFMALRTASLIFRFLRRWMRNPLVMRSSLQFYGQQFALGEKRPLAGKAIQSVRFLWVCESLEALQWFKDDLCAILNRSFEAMPGFMDIDVYVNDSSLSVEDLAASVAGTPLEHRVKLARPLLLPILAEIRDERIRDCDESGVVTRTGVFFSGALLLEAEVKRICASFSSPARARFLFLTENFEIGSRKTGARQRRAPFVKLEREWAREHDLQVKAAEKVAAESWSRSGSDGGGGTGGAGASGRLSSPTQRGSVVSEERQKQTSMVNIGCEMEEVVVHDNHVYAFGDYTEGHRHASATSMEEASADVYAPVGEYEAEEESMDRLRAMMLVAGGGGLVSAGCDGGGACGDRVVGVSRKMEIDVERGLDTEQSASVLPAPRGARAAGHGVVAFWS